ncbi:hypothetical protein [Ralstonia pseudosolanacearum]|uniref:hypothetical protein n=1 Tax=Ralstonia pseudosolanacearum TaxID=1310165 RepID=UPI003CF02971
MQAESRWSCGALCDLLRSKRRLACLDAGHWRNPEEAVVNSEDLLACGFVLCLAVMGTCLGIGIGIQVADSAGFDTSEMATRIVIGLCAIPVAYLYKNLLFQVLSRPIVR